jgi:hypothetical protein
MSYNHRPTRTIHVHARVGSSAHNIHPTARHVLVGATSTEHYIVQRTKSAGWIAMAGRVAEPQGMHACTPSWLAPQVDQSFAFVHLSASAPKWTPNLMDAMGVRAVPPQPAGT